jgi:hypothetical protein
MAAATASPAAAQKDYGSTAAFIQTGQAHVKKPIPVRIADAAVAGAHNPAPENVLNSNDPTKNPANRAFVGVATQTCRGALDCLNKGLDHAEKYGDANCGDVCVKSQGATFEDVEGLHDGVQSLQKEVGVGDNSDSSRKGVAKDFQTRERGWYQDVKKGEITKDQYIEGVISDPEFIAEHLKDKRRQEEEAREEAGKESRGEDSEGGTSGMGSD